MEKNEFVIDRSKKCAIALDEFIHLINVNGLSDYPEVMEMIKVARNHIRDLLGCRGGVAGLPNGEYRLEGHEERYTDYQRRGGCEALAENIGRNLNKLEKRDREAALKVVNILLSGASDFSAARAGTLASDLLLYVYPLSDASILFSLEDGKRLSQTYPGNQMNNLGHVVDHDDYKLPFNQKCVATLISSRRSEIDGFVEGGMEDFERQKFIEELRRNRSLRYAVAFVRMNVLAKGRQLPLPNTDEDLVTKMTQLPLASFEEAIDILKTAVGQDLFPEMALEDVSIDTSKKEGIVVPNCCWRQITT